MEAKRYRLYTVIEKAEVGDTPSMVFDWFIIILIIANITAVILESFHNIAVSCSYVLRLFELVSVGIFTLEYFCRLITADYKYPDKKKAYAVICFVFSGMAIVDILAILPFYLPMLIAMDLRFLRILRLTRILRILKIQRYSKALSLIGTVFRKKKDDLAVTVFVTSLLLLLASALMYNIENEAQPEQFPNIIASFWWGIATLTTIGYGDIYPVTVLGKILSGVIALLGIGIIALPTGIISSGFIEEIHSKNTKSTDAGCVNYCPKCGEKLS